MRITLKQNLRFFMSLIVFYTAMLCASTVMAKDLPEDANPNAMLINVKDYGAYTNDDVDDTEAIQNALSEALHTHRPLVVEMYIGTYNLSHALTVYSNTYVYMKSRTILETTANEVFTNGHLDENGNICNNRTENCSHGNYNQSHDITLNGGILCRVEERQSGGFVMFTHAENITIEEMIVDGPCTHAIRLYGCRNVTIDSCKVKNNSKNTGREDAGAYESIQIGDNCSGASAGYPYPHDDSISKNITISNCVFQNVLTGIGNHGDCIMGEGIEIYKCTFRDIGGDEDYIVYNGGGYGVNLTTLSYGEVHDNVFEINARGKAAILGTLWKKGRSVGHDIYGNVIIHESPYGICLKNGAEGMVHNNWIFDASYGVYSSWNLHYGVYIGKSSKAEVFNNEIYSTYKDVFDEPGESRIHDNYSYEIYPYEE